jgi:hypothetical protein
MLMLAQGYSSLPWSASGESVSCSRYFCRADGTTEFIALLGGVSFAWPLVEGAEHPTMPVDGFVSAALPLRISARAEQDRIR